MNDESDHIKTYDATQLCKTLPSVHEFVTRTDGRIEITRDGSDDRCVLISKRELQCIEHALEILSNTEGVRDLCHEITQLAAAAQPALAAGA